MASPQQPAPPSNPFDGFDNYATVAQQPPQPHLPQQQQQPVSPNQWGQQQQQPMAHQPVAVQQQPPAATAAGSPTMMMASAPNPFAAAAASPPATSPANNANPFAIHPGGLVPPTAAPVAAAPVVAQQQQQLQPAMAYPQQQQPPQQQQQLQQQQQQPHQQQLVTLAPNAIVPASPWALQPVGGAPAAAPSAAQSYDPLGIFGAPTQAPQQQTQQVQQHYQQPVQQPYQQPAQQPVFQAQQQQPQFQAQQHQYAPQQQHTAQPPSAQQKLQEEVQQFNLESHNQSMLPDESEDEGLALIDVELDDEGDDDNTENLENRKKDGEFLDSTAINEKKNRKSSGSPRRQSNSWDRNPDIAPPPPITPGRHHAEYLSQNSAPALSSPLPRQELVHHSGYVLSRISFRTVLMRKWKQTFWIQYGPTQLLFFRTFSDYEDWVNNPYHTIKAREFLVKLRVDFVSDLKKSSVMGYQVTQVRRKPYGKNVMLHFKLERWMDYGPTIAAAFAAREEEMMNSPTHRQNNGSREDFMDTSNDVAALRKIILGCMRNARDAALVASRREQTDMGEAVGHRGRYDEEHSRDARIPSGPSNMGYHQAFSAESSGRRRMSPDGVPASSPSPEPSRDEVETENVAPPVVDLLG